MEGFSHQTTRGTKPDRADVRLASITLADIRAGSRLRICRPDVVSAGSARDQDGNVCEFVSMQVTLDLKVVVVLDVDPETVVDAECLCQS